VSRNGIVLYLLPVISVEQDLLDITFQIFDSGLDVIHPTMESEIVLHMNPICRPEFIQFIPNNIHTLAMALLFWTLHIIINPIILLLHLGPVLLR
jgi:hypothetical protein